jgi:hypothetical protein
MTTPDKSEKNITQNPARALLISFSVGCLTFLIAGLAVAAGILIDLRNDTLPRWTLIFLVGSAPITLGGVYLLARRVLKKKSNGKAELGEGEGGETELD